MSGKLLAGHLPPDQASNRKHSGLGAPLVFRRRQVVRGRQCGVARHCYAPPRNARVAQSWPCPSKNRRLAKNKSHQFDAMQEKNLLTFRRTSAIMCHILPSFKRTSTLIDRDHVSGSILFGISIRVFLPERLLGSSRSTNTLNNPDELRVRPGAVIRKGSGSVREVREATLARRGLVRPGEVREHDPG